MSCRAAILPTRGLGWIVESESEHTGDEQEIARLRQELERLRKIEQRFENFTNSVSDFALIALDLNNCVTGWNKGAERLLGYTEGEILGKPGSTFLTPEDVLAGQPDRETATARAKGRAEDGRWHIRKNGTRFWASGVLTPLRGDTGSIYGYAKIMRDGTERRETLEALRASEERFRLVVENVRDCALFPVDLEGNVTDWNPGARRIFGYEAQDVLGRSVFELFAVDSEAEHILQDDLQQASKEGASAAEAWLRRKDGSQFYARWVTNTMHDSGGRLIGYTKVLRDETDRKKAEEERELQFRRERALLEGQVRFTSSALTRTKEDLEDLAGQLLNAQDDERRTIARDLHDHLAQRLALMDIRLTKLRGELPGTFNSVQTQLAAIQGDLSALADEVRDLSHRLHPSTLENIGLVPALKTLVEQFCTTRSSRVELHVDDFSEEGLPPEVTGSLYRIAEETLRNVQQHAGDVPVKISLYRNPEAVHLEVGDEGPGFPQQPIQRRKTLGLISMSERARSVKGTFDLVSTPGRGTVVQVTVPVNQT